MEEKKPKLGLVGDEPESGPSNDTETNPSTTSRRCAMPRTTTNS